VTGLDISERSAGVALAIAFEPDVIVPSTPPARIALGHPVGRHGGGVMADERPAPSCAERPMTRTGKPSFRRARYPARSAGHLFERKRFMNKSQLIEAVAADSGLSKTESTRAIESLLGTVTKTLKKGDQVIITGFGKFSVVKRAARQGVNPRTGERVKIKASKAPKFSAGATLKQAVSGKK
jgi:DNA-binding protein HU-beta